MINLDDLERIARAADTPGPWVPGDRRLYPCSSASDGWHIAANSPPVTLVLIAIARAALAHIEAYSRQDLGVAEWDVACADTRCDLREALKAIRP